MSKPGNTAGAQYLLRFDDLCPTMDWERWQRWAELLERFAVKPILAVVPANRDPQLVREPVREAFWAEMRRWQAMGAAIALHGWTHQCVSSGPSLVPLQRYSEFAGVDEPTQREWIEAGLSTLRQQGIEAAVWVAPRHGFDRVTLKVLRQAGITVVSDGLGTRPVEREGMLWLPQQLWSPQEKRSGLWTICVHANTAGDSDRTDMERFLNRNRDRMMTVERVSTEWSRAQWGAQDWLAEQVALGRIRARGLRQRLQRQV